MAKQQHHQLPNKGITLYAEISQYPPMAGAGGSFIKILEPTGFRYSGYKYHIYGNSYDDVVLLLDKIYDIVNSAGCIMKAARKEFFQAERDPSAPQHGKAITIYIPFNMKSTGGEVGLGFLLGQALQNYNKNGIINGENRVSENIFLRYDLDIPWEEVKEKKGLTQKEYDDHYNSAAG